MSLSHFVITLFSLGGKFGNTMFFVHALGSAMPTIKVKESLNVLILFKNADHYQILNRIISVNLLKVTRKPAQCLPMICHKS